MEDEDEIATSAHPAITMARKIAAFAGEGGQCLELSLTTEGDGDWQFEALCRQASGAAARKTYRLTKEHVQALCKPFSSVMVHHIANDILTGAAWDDRSGAGFGTK